MGNLLIFEWVDIYILVIMQVWYLGQEVGRVLVNLLFGNENLLGKLFMIIYKIEEQLLDILDFDMWKGCIYCYMKGEFLYGFGYGLSYIFFEFDNI